MIDIIIDIIIDVIIIILPPSESKLPQIKTFQSL